MHLIQVELYKIFTKPRSFIGIATIALIVILIEFALYVDGKDYLQFIFQSMEQTFEISGNILNGNLVAFIILQTLIVQMPLLVALVTGDMISGEAASGTIRLVVTRAVSRNHILFAKYVAGSIYSLALIIWLGVLAIGLGYLLFGTGDLVVLKSEELVILPAADVLWRFMAAFLIAFLSLNVVCAFSLMLSCFTDNSIAPIVSTMSVIILFTIIGTMEVPVFDYVKPVLFTTHMIIWKNMFDNPIDYPQIYQSLGILVGYIVLFMSIAFYHFNKKDILN
ncbi:MAG: ABC transporter permease subunit [Chitinophagales bacterium]|jgi:ABC-2 type transport system permease protein|nr:ABC transporter permease subunit [Chitinophagales bacterium]